MPRFLIIWLALLASCGPDPASVSVPRILLPDLDLTPCPGWTGPRPATLGTFADAAAAEKHGRLCNARKMDSARQALQQVLVPEPQ